MMWRLFSWGRKNKKNIRVDVKIDINLDRANEELKAVEKKLEDTKAKAPELARAVASARRVHYRVDQFTEEISKSFGRLGHG